MVQLFYGFWEKVGYQLLTSLFLDVYITTSFPILSRYTKIMCVLSCQHFILAQLLIRPFQTQIHLFPANFLFMKLMHVVYPPPSLSLSTSISLSLPVQLCLCVCANIPYCPYYRLNSCRYLRFCTSNTQKHTTCLGQHLKQHTCASLRLAELHTALQDKLPNMLLVVSTHPNLSRAA